MAGRGGNDFKLVIPKRGERVKINSGSTLTVSCHLSPAISAVDMEVSWYGETSCVCAYKNRKMTPGVDYEDRASLFIHDLMKGNVSLRVSDYREADLGVYMCQVTGGNTTQQITVNVAEEVSAIFKDFFTVDYKMGGKSNKLNQSAYHSNSDNQLQDNRMGTKIQATDPNETNKNRYEHSCLFFRLNWYSKMEVSKFKNPSYSTKENCTLHMYVKVESPSFSLFFTENFQLVAPSAADEARVSLGCDFIIPCHLSPGISALDMEIRWSKDTACVCLYKDRRLTEGVFFKDRVSMFTHKLGKGNVSLVLKNFMLSDVGNYHCQVTSKDKTEEITVRVRLDPGVQSMSQSPIFQDGNAQSMLYKDKKTIEPSKNSSSQSEKKQHRNFSTGVSSNDHFHLVIPQTTQKATISTGSEFTVPCYLSPEICATTMQIKWFKETDCACVYKNRHVIEGRAYKDRVSLVTHELERGNVSLHLNNFSVSDVGDYHCQVISGDRTKEITVGVRIKPEVQPVSQSPTSQDGTIQLMLFEIHKIWTEEETNKMDESALMSEMKVNNVQELHQMLIKAYTEKDRQLERTEQALRETRKNLDRALKLHP
ncbi:butyrophilin-like protein 2 [Pseudorasbora parva]|uniref:butyrophilin-like protein 2 n=1 Tax=Pseudorasbora parva TaxID=51549 RepID=UPI00351EB4AF